VHRSPSSKKTELKVRFYSFFEKKSNEKENFGNFGNDGCDQFS